MRNKDLITSGGKLVWAIKPYHKETLLKKYLEKSYKEKHYIPAGLHKMLVL